MEDDVDNSLEHLFQCACDYIRRYSSSFDGDKLLQFYAYYKQSTEGPCNRPKPGFFDFQGKQKWESWKQLGSMSKDEAMHGYVKLLENSDPDWDDKYDNSDGSDSSSIGGNWISVSTMSNMDTDIADENKTIFDWCKEGNTQEVQELIRSVDVNVTDDAGMTLLHWACDRGFPDIVKTLLGVKADINAVDAEHQTALHYAVCCDHRDVVELLLSHGINTSILDCDGLAVTDLDTTPEIKQLLNDASPKNTLQT